MELDLRPPLTLTRPLMNAAGALGFAPDLRLPLQWDLFGAFVTHPISQQARKSAAGPRWLEVPGGALLHTGYPNPGFRRVVEVHAPLWEQSPLPVIVHLLANDPRLLSRMVMQLEVLNGVAAVEVGLPDAVSSHEAREIVLAAVGERPVIARVSLTRALDLAEPCWQAGASAVSLGPARGSAAAGGGFVSGRLVGPGVLPLALHTVRSLASQGIPVVGAGGVYTPEDVRAMQDAGAAAVQLDAGLWRGGWFRAQQEAQ